MCLLGNLGEFPEHTNILRGCYLVHLIKSVAEQILIKATSSLMKCSVVISVFIAPRFKSHLSFLTQISHSEGKHNLQQLCAQETRHCDDITLC